MLKNDENYYFHSVTFYTTFIRMFLQRKSIQFNDNTDIKTFI